MGSDKLKQKLRWYKMVGFCAEQKETPVVAFVEASSRKKVVKYHGGRRKHTSPQGDVLVDFPTAEKDIQILSKKWTPSQTAELVPAAIVEVIPVTHYRCECGKEHLSEFPYPSMWCTCGGKAWPVPPAADPSVITGIPDHLHATDTFEEMTL